MCLYNLTVNNSTCQENNYTAPLYWFAQLYLLTQSKVVCFYMAGKPEWFVHLFYLSLLCSKLCLRWEQAEGYPQGTHGCSSYGGRCPPGVGSTNWTELELGCEPRLPSAAERPRSSRLAAGCSWGKGKKYSIFLYLRELKSKSLSTPKHCPNHPAIKYVFWFSIVEEG